MPTTLKMAAESYLRAKALSRATRNEYLSALRKWEKWGGGIPVEQLARKDIREFLDWVYYQAVTGEGENPGRTANKAREQIRAILYWAWEQELIDTLPRFPAPIDQRDVAGRHYLTKAEINALYFATHKMGRPRGWDAPHPIGRYWRAALVVFFNHGVDTPWDLNDLRKTCATYYDEHVPESSVEILGHSVGGITCRHYAHRAPLAFQAIITTRPITGAVSQPLRGH
jgi:hypothetical protein